MLCNIFAINHPFDDANLAFDKRLYQVDINAFLTVAVEACQNFVAEFAHALRVF